MKNISKFVIIAIAAFLTSCVNAAKFPVSSTVPAAEIKATKTQDKNNNYIIELTAVNLAEASRLSPPMNNYSVWIVVDNSMAKNIGQLTNKNGGKTVLKTLTPYNVTEIFITAEKQGDLSYPAGVEISRSTFKK